MTTALEDDLIPDQPSTISTLDFVVALMEQHVPGPVNVFCADFYIDEDDARTAVRSQRMFNLMHLVSGIKVDLIVRKDSEYRRVEFARRQPVNLAGVATWITAREDLILSKLVWARDAESELQKRDVRTLLDDTVDSQYLKEWAPKLGVAEILDDIAK